MTDDLHTARGLFRAILICLLIQAATWWAVYMTVTR